MLEIKELKAGVEDNPILKGINLEVNAGEIHAIMGPNGLEKALFLQLLQEEKITRLKAEQYILKEKTY